MQLLLTRWGQFIGRAGNLKKNVTHLYTKQHVTHLYNTQHVTHLHTPNTPLNSPRHKEHNTTIVFCSP